MDFARVLLVGVVLFAVLLIFFGGQLAGFGGDTGGEGYHFGPVPSPEDGENGEDEEEAEGGMPGDAFFVGNKKTTDFRYFSLSGSPFSVSFKEKDMFLGSVDETEIKNGFFSSEPSTVTFNLTKDQIEKTNSFGFSFYVEDTNFFGRLLFDLNGERAFSRFVKPERTYSVDVNSSLLDESNELRVHAEPSGWKFWAPTVYILKNLTAEARIMGRDEKSFSFELDKEQAENFEMGRVVLKPEEFDPNQPLVLQVNGRDVYRNITPAPSRPSLWIDFDDANVKKGKNELTFFSGYNSSYGFKSGEFIVFWSSETGKVTSKILDVSSSQYSRLPGEISFDIEKIDGSPKSLNLNIITPDDEENKILIQQVLKEGKTISIELTKDDIAQGENELQFIVEGEGGFHLSNFDVDY